MFVSWVILITRIGHLGYAAIIPGDDYLMPEAALCKGLIEHVIWTHVTSTSVSLPSITLEETSLLRVQKNDRAVGDYCRSYTS